MQVSSDKSMMLQHFHIDAATFKLCGLRVQTCLTESLNEKMEKMSVGHM